MVDSTNPRIMADNIKMLAASSGGSSVVANPEGEATEDLAKLEVDGTVYGIPEIEVNPEGEATEDLAKLEVGGTIYAIPEPESGVAYSTTEQKIGKWVDNKDLYMRTFTTDSGVTSWTFINDSSIDIKGCIPEATYADCSSSAGYHRLNPGCNVGGASVNFVIDDTGTTHGKATLYTTIPSGGPMMYRAVATIIYTK